jgi:hypothetical protein
LLRDAPSCQRPTALFELCQFGSGGVSLGAIVAEKCVGEATVLKAGFGRASERGGGTGAMIVPWLVQKMRQALTLLATIENDHHGMKTLAVISILALLTISGAAYTDQLLTSDQQTMQRAD